MAIHILGNYVLPILGILIAWALALSPLKRVMQAEHDKSLRDYNPLPSTVFLMNSVAWLFYGGLIKNIFIIVLKIVLVVVNLQLSLRSYIYATAECRQQMEAIIQISIAILMVFYVLFFYDVTPDRTLLVYGYLCLVLNLLIFVAPFSTIRVVIANKNSSPIHIPFAVMGFLGTFFWFIYGLVIDEIPLIIPNAVGILLNILQLVLCVLFKREALPQRTISDGNEEM
ncbi:unnamed protein product, partial [Ectocarpus fasciculatus]